MTGLEHLLDVRTVGRLTGAARDVAAHFAVTGWWNWPDQGNNLETGHRVHESDEHLGVADVAGRGLLRGRGHLSPSYNKRHWPPTSPKSPVTGRFPGNAVRQEPRRAPEIALEDSHTFWVGNDSRSRWRKRLAVVPVNRRTRQGIKQRTKTLQQPMWLFTETRT